MYIINIQGMTFENGILTLQVDNERKMMTNVHKM